MATMRAVAGDTFDLLAYAAYGDERRTAQLMEANPQYIGRLPFHGGEVLEVPEIEDAPPATLPPWKRGG